MALRSAFRDDMSVLTAMVTRVDSSLNAILAEVQAVRRKFNRFSDRVGQLAIRLAMRTSARS